LAKISVEGSVWGDLGRVLHGSEVGEVSAISQVRVSGLLIIKRIINLILGGT
jgi:hypothetical protein